MALQKTEKKIVKDAIARSLQAKFSSYAPPAKTPMPFQTRLLGKDRMALFSFIHSLNTSFGTAIYEPVAAAIAKNNSAFVQVACQKKANGKISAGAQTAISKIKNSLEQAQTAPNQQAETEALRAVCQTGGDVSVKLRRADL